MRHELDLIRTMKYAPYFLTVFSIVRYAGSEGILCQGRGSAANSAVCYILGITSIESAAILSPSRTRATNLRRSSIRLHSCQGTFALLAKAKSVTHVSGMNCHPSLGKD